MSDVQYPYVQYNVSSQDTSFFCHQAKERPSSQVHSAARDTWNEQGGMLISCQADMLAGWAQISVERNSS